MSDPIHFSHRRDFLRMGAAAGAGLALGAVGLPRLMAAAGDPPFKISLAEWSLHNTLNSKKLDNLDFPAFAKNECGIDAVEYVNQFFKDKARDETYLKAAGKEYEVDCVIYASGFEVGTEYTRRAGYDLTGRDGVKLSEYWDEGMRTLHGIHVHGFPNAFVVQPTQGANLISNIPHNLTEAGRTIALTIKHALDNGFDEIEVTKEAEDAWIELLLSGTGRLLGSPDCTPGYYNNEGQDSGLRGRLNVGYPQGAMAYFTYLDKWRSSGAFEGLEFR